MADDSLKNLKEEAKLRAQMSTSLEAYLKGVEDIKTYEKTISDNLKYQELLRSKMATESDADAAATKKQIEYLVEVNGEYDKILINLKSAVKATNSFQMASISAGKALSNGLANLPGLIQNSFGKLKSYGLFDMDKAIKMSALQMGLLGKESDSYYTTISKTAESTNDIGVGVEALAKMQGQYTEDLGRSVILGDKGLKSMAAMSKVTGLGAEGTGELAANMDEVGLSAERTGGYIEQTMNDSHKLGLNASKVVKNIAGNIKMLNKYHFKDGIAGLAKMAELSAKLGVKMDFAAAMSDKVWDIEGAVDMSAQLQVMGGAWAKMADPFHLMYMAREDVAGLTTEIASAAQESMHFAKDGSIEMSSLAMSKLKIIAKETGLEYDDLVKSGKEMFKMNKVGGQISLPGLDKDTKEFIANTAQLDKSGKATIEIKGSTKLVSQLDANDASWLQIQVKDKASMVDRAKASQNFDDNMTNLINQVKTYMLPIITGINDTLGPIVKSFMKDPTWQKQLYDFGVKMGNFIKGLAPLFETIGGWVKTLGPGGTLSVLFGGKVLFNLAQWTLNGVSLASGFMSAVNGGGLLGGLGKTGAAVGGGLGRGAIVAGGLGAAGYGVGALTDATTEKGSGMNILGNAAADAIKGAAFGTMFGPEGTVVGAIGGAIYGGVKAAMSAPATPPTPPSTQTTLPTTLPTTSPAQDALSQSGYNRGILAGGAITPISNKDSLMSYKPQGPIDNILNQKATTPSNIEITFQPLQITGSLMINTPFGGSVPLDLLKDAHFIRQITNLIHVETKRSLNQKQ